MINEATMLELARERVRELEMQHFRLRLMLAESNTDSATKQLSAEIAELERRLIIHTTPEGEQQDGASEPGEGAPPVPPADNPDGPVAVMPDPSSPGDNAGPLNAPEPEQASPSADADAAPEQRSTSSGPVAVNGASVESPAPNGSSA